MLVSGVYARLQYKQTIHNDSDSSEMFVHFPHTTWRHTPQDSVLTVTAE
jgi:hypothetical protein